MQTINKNCEKLLQKDYLIKVDNKYRFLYYFKFGITLKTSDFEKNINE